ncbi:MAG: leucine-rich repeat-containing protein 40 [Bacteroidota bacterium]|jgi:Leucine-rich repeat (LRR) protein
MTIAWNQLPTLPGHVRHLHALVYLDLRHNRLQRLPSDLALIEGLGQVLLEGNPLNLSIAASHPEGVLERFLRDLHQRSRTQNPYPAQTRQCWLRMLQGDPALLEDFPADLCVAALDSPMSAVREAAAAVLSALTTSPIPPSGPATIFFAGQFPRIQKSEVEKAMLSAGFNIERRLLPAPMTVVLGDRPGALRESALRSGHRLAFEGHVEAWLASYKGKFLVADPGESTMAANLRRLIRSYKKENIEIAAMMMAGAGTPASLLTDLLAIRLFHKDPEVRNITGGAFARLADRQLKAFVDRQLAQHFQEEDDYDVEALVAALARNASLEAGTLVGAAMELKQAGLGLAMLLPESERFPHYMACMKDGQLQLAGLGFSSFPESLKLLPDLRFLMLSRNHLRHLPEDLTPFSPLEMLDLAENRLAELPDGIQVLQHLTGLDLSQNRLRQLPPSMGRLGRLEALRLDHNPLADLPETLSGMKRLEMLGLYGCRLGQVPSVVWELDSLRSLDLGQCFLQCLPDVIPRLPLLESFGLRDNPLQALPEWIGHLQGLKYLDLSLVSSRTLPESLTGHSSLQRIYLIRDDSMDWEQVLPILASMPKLQYAYLRGKRIVRNAQLLIEERLPGVRVFWNG